MIENGANASAARNDGATPLFIAAQNGNLENQNVVKLKAINRFSCLGHEQVIETLIQSGANISATNVNGTTPLFIAAQKGRPTMHYVYINISAE